MPTLVELGWVDTNVKAPTNELDIEAEAGDTHVDLEKICWIANVSKYQELRMIKGCDNLLDLNETNESC